MNNLTYFLGAGASAGTKKNPAIPILLGFNEKLTGFFNELLLKELNDKDPSHTYTKLSDEDFLNDVTGHIPLLKELKYSGGGQIFTNEFIYFVGNAYEVLNELNDHTTVDTLARKYYLLGSDGKTKLVALKALISMYFLHLQQNEKRFDMRYDSFISTLLERGKHGSLELPNSVKVISWNYDLQFEMALKKYQKSKLKEIQEQFSIHPSMAYHGTTQTKTVFGMVKLNGTTGLFFDLQNKLVRDIDEIAPELMERKELFDLFYGICRSGKFSISPFYRYSWEDDNERFERVPNMKELLNGYAKEIMRDTHHLVVVGYSFPPFNRRTDIALFNCLPNNAIVYIQDTNPVRKQNVLDIFKSFEEKNITVEFIEDVSQFYIPPVYFEL